MNNDRIISIAKQSVRTFTCAFFRNYEKDLTLDTLLVSAISSGKAGWTVHLTTSLLNKLSFTVFYELESDRITVLEHKEIGGATFSFNAVLKELDGVNEQRSHVSRLRLYVWQDSGIVSVAPSLREARRLGTRAFCEMAKEPGFKAWIVQKRILLEQKPQLSLPIDEQRFSMSYIEFQDDTLRKLNIDKRRYNFYEL